MKFGFCQIFYSVLLAMNLGMHMAKHGETRTTKYNFGVALLAVAIEATLLYFGGFYS